MVVMRLYTLVTAIVVAAFGVTLAAQDAFKKSDPALLAKTGRPQLVEFYHPG